MKVKKIKKLVKPSKQTNENKHVIAYNYNKNCSGNTNCGFNW